MAGKTLDLRNIISEDSLGSRIAIQAHEWFTFKQPVASEWEETRKYIFATDTSKTSNSTLPWKNKTTLPKMCQIRDNLNANYMVRLFPKRKFLKWLANNKDDNSKAKRDAILNYMYWVTAQPQFKEEMAKLILDYIDYGNCFATVEWVDQRIKNKFTGTTSGYVGPAIRRISPTDIVFNPIASSFVDSPKIIRSFITMGELKKKLESLSTDENREEYKALFEYICTYRQTAQATQSTGTELIAQDDHFRIDGFGTFREYLASDYVEVLTFYGDLFDWEKKELLQNHVIMVVDRHKVISKKPNPTYFGYPPIFNCGWRIRQDNLWAMGPLHNLTGLQYRLDHLENMKSDILDMIAFPVFKQKGYVDNWEYGPGQRINLTGENDDVEMMAPPYQCLQMNTEIQSIFQIMEELSGSPKEAMGFRTPGEKTALEVSRQENASSRIFSNKTNQFEEFEERLLNAMAELARRQISGPQEINVFDDEFKLQTFMTLTADDITGAGTIKPIAARHFAEQAETIQNLTNFYSSAIGADPDIKVHFSSIKTAQMVEDLLDLQEYNLFLPYVRITEQQDAQKLQNAGMEQTQMEAQTPHGLTPDDHSGPPSLPPMPPQGQPEQ